MEISPIAKYYLRDIKKDLFGISALKEETNIYITKSVIYKSNHGVTGEIVYVTAIYTKSKVFFSFSVATRGV